MERRGRPSQEFEIAQKTGDVYEMMKFLQAERAVSKYIGETEKNMDLISDEEKDADAILLFDEADALFSKRSEVQNFLDG